MQEDNAFKGILNLDNDIDENKIEMRGKKKPTKKEYFDKEQNIILEKINKIIGISKENNIIYLYELENDKDKRDKLLALSDDIQKYFKTGTWGFYRKDICKNNHVLLCKSVYKSMGLQLVA